MPIDLDTLNGPQREAVLCTEGPLLVLAGAGSGKTRVLTHRIAHLVEDLNVAPWQIMAITFTNKAAAEMRERLQSLIGGGARGMWVSTFHSMCVRILRTDCERVGFAKGFTIYDDSDSKRLVEQIMDELNIDKKRYPIPALRNRISQAKNDLQVAEVFAEKTSDQVGQVAARVHAPTGAPASAKCLRLRRLAAVHLASVEEPPRCVGCLSEPFPLPDGGRIPGYQSCSVCAYPALGGSA